MPLPSRKSEIDASLAARGILEATDRIPDLALDLVGLAFRLGLRIPGHLAGNFLDLSFGLLERAFDAVFVHMVLLSLDRWNNPPRPAKFRSAKLTEMTVSCSTGMRPFARNLAAAMERMERATVVSAHRQPESRTMAKEPKTLDDLFHDTLKDIYYAERKILAALPKMARAAQSEDL